MGRLPRVPHGSGPAASTVIPRPPSAAMFRVAASPSPTTIRRRTPRDRERRLRPTHRDSGAGHCGIQRAPIGRLGRSRAGGSRMSLWLPPTATTFSEGTNSVNAGTVGRKLVPRRCLQAVSAALGSRALSRPRHHALGRRLARRARRNAVGCETVENQTTAECPSSLSSRSLLSAATSTPERKRSRARRRA